jgi:hypothetical protein
MEASFFVEEKPAYKGAFYEIKISMWRAKYSLH